MRLARVYSRACAGIEAPLITVEVHIGGGLPRMSLVGLPETAVRESRDRVRAALANAGFEVPVGLVTISLAPAELPKEGGGFDLPIALGILAASAQIPHDRLEEAEFMGELSLGGELRPIRGALAAAVRVTRNNRALVIPVGNGREVSLLKEGTLLCAESLSQVTAWLARRGNLAAIEPAEDRCDHSSPDLADVVGQTHAQRALQVAAAGAHNLLMVGPPGTGKTMLAARIPGILPPMTEAEALETAAVASVSQQGLDIDRWRCRPFRAPHHTCSAIALVGGGSRPRPGEISLAHNGVLFLDELPEFSRHVLEVLREPLESGRIVIARAAGTAEFPARFQLVCAMNPCPCGYAGDPGGRCHCSADQIQRYLHRISGPLLDRIDIQVEVPRPKVSVIASTHADGTPSGRVRERVTAARTRQLERCGVPNAHMKVSDLHRHAALNPEQRRLLEAAANRWSLSPRACHRILRVARTVADLDAADSIGTENLTEAISLRRMSTGS